MGVEAKHDIDRPCIRKVLRCSIRMGYRCASEHWVLLSLILLLYLLFKSSPGFFAFILSSSPVIICTTLLLGVLLTLGSTNFPEIDGDGKARADISAPKFSNFSRNIHSEAHRRFPAPSFKENTVSFKHEEIKEAIFSRMRATKHFEMDDSVPLLKDDYQESEVADASDIHILEKTLTSIPSMVTLHDNVGMEEFMEDNQGQESKDLFSGEVKGDDKYDNLFKVVHQSRIVEIQPTFGLYSSSENVREDAEMVAKENHDRELTDSQRDVVRVVSEDKPAEKPACRWGRAFSVRQRKKLCDLKVEPINAAVDSQLDSSLGSPFAVGSHDGSSCFGSEKAAMMTDIAPAPNEIDPLLVDDFPCPDPTINDGLQGHSNMSPLDTKIDSDSNDNRCKAKDDGEKNVGNESTFIWTDGDEKNVMDLGYSEMERNRRLEIMMVKRRSRKNIRFDLRRNFIDDNRDDFCRRANDNVLSSPVQLQPISVPRRNPFNLLSGSDETEIPGSAPSILQPRNDMFDSPFDQSDESGVPEHDNFGHQEIVSASHRNMFFRRHESFNVGSQERRLSRFKPCFILDAMEIEEPRASDFQRQFSDRSESKLSAVTESDIISSLADQDDHDNRIENDFNTELESPVLPTQEKWRGVIDNQFCGQ